MVVYSCLIDRLNGFPLLARGEEEKHVIDEEFLKVLFRYKRKWLTNINRVRLTFTWCYRRCLIGLKFEDYDSDNHDQKRLV